MSHFATVQTRITDLACLKQALADLGHAVEEGAADVRGYRGAREKADLVVRTGSAYDVGVRKVGDAYELVADWWGVETGRWGLLGWWTTLACWACTLGVVYFARFLQGKWRTMRVIEPELVLEEELSTDVNLADDDRAQFLPDESQR